MQIAADVLVAEKRGARGLVGSCNMGPAMARTDVSLAEARRIALAAQGFDLPRPPGGVTTEELGRTVQALGVVQIDYVNVLVPAQYQVPFSRLGPYQRAQLDDLVYRRRELTEQWAHEASIVPVDTWPLLRHRRAKHRIRPRGFDRFLALHEAYVEWVLDEVRARGPLTADDLPAPPGEGRRIAGAWHTVPRAVLEAHFGRGLLAVAARRPNFARAFDLAERVIDRVHHGHEVRADEAERELVRRAARAHGIATAGDLADYYHVPIRDARVRIAELVSARELVEVRVEGWREPAFLHRAARVPPRLHACALVSPFDPLIWTRDRAARLYGFDYRIEIWVPAARRRFGYYVLPFLYGDRLVARVDLKADRPARRLDVLAAFAEQHAPRAAAAALAAELRVLAGWLGLDEVRIGRRGDMAAALSRAVKAGRT